MSLPPTAFALPRYQPKEAAQLQSRWLCTQEGPGEAAVQALNETVETPERLWTPAMKASTAEELAHLADQAHAAQVPPSQMYPCTNVPTYLWAVLQYDMP